jgi:murein DD-endopeptidase MepM/ murein hydrolase activator NlpD
VYQPEPKEAPAREAVWNARLSALPGLARLLPSTSESRLLTPIMDVQVNQIADTWGAPRGEGLKHVGQDIFAKRGTLVYSATYGVVWMIGTSVRGGWVCVLGAGGRRYYYAHLERVTTASVLGQVSTSRDAEDTPPHLQFAMFGRDEKTGPAASRR